MSRTFVASIPGNSMIFKTNAKGKIIWASPQMPKTRGTHVLNLRRSMRRAGFAFYEIKPLTTRVNA